MEPSSIFSRFLFSLQTLFCSFCRSLSFHRQLLTPWSSWTWKLHFWLSPTDKIHRITATNKWFYLQPYFPFIYHAVRQQSWYPSPGLRAGMYTKAHRTPFIGRMGGLKRMKDNEAAVHGKIWWDIEEGKSTHKRGFGRKASMMDQESLNGHCIGLRLWSSCWLWQSDGEVNFWLYCKKMLNANLEKL